MRSAWSKPCASFVYSSLDRGLRAGAATAHKQRLAPHKYPRWIWFVDELPKTATGKIQRFKLKEAAAQR
jgi:acyl-coenzyme A synthetase/AMP-(fatty) acid ligase